MAGMAYLKVFFDWLGPLEQLNDEEAGRLFRAALLYARDGIDVPLSGNERFVFSLLRAQIDRDKASWKAKSEILSEAGKRGAAARWDNSQAKPGQAKDGQAKSNIARYGLNSQEKEKEKDQDKDQEGKILNTTVLMHSCHQLSDTSFNDMSSIPEKSTHLSVRESWKRSKRF